MWRRPSSTRCAMALEVAAQRCHHSGSCHSGSCHSDPVVACAARAITARAPCAIVVASAAWTPSDKPLQGIRPLHGIRCLHGIRHVQGIRDVQGIRHVRGIKHLQGRHLQGIRPRQCIEHLQGVRQSQDVVVVDKGASSSACPPDRHTEPQTTQQRSPVITATLSTAAFGRTDCTVPASLSRLIIDQSAAEIAGVAVAAHGSAPPAATRAIL
jgi:hypothetical protein